MLCLLCLLGLRVESLRRNAGDLGEEHDHRVLEVPGRAARPRWFPRPPAVARAVVQVVASERANAVLPELAHSAATGPPAAGGAQCACSPRRLQAYPRPDVEGSPTISA